MPIDVTNERRFEEDIEAFFLTEQGGYTKTTDTYDPAVGLYTDTLIGSECVNIDVARFFRNHTNFLAFGFKISCSLTINFLVLRLPHRLGNFSFA